MHEITLSKNSELSAKFEDQNSELRAELQAQQAQSLELSAKLQAFSAQVEKHERLHKLYMPQIETAKPKSVFNGSGFPQFMPATPYEPDPV